MNAVHRVLDPRRAEQIPPGLCALAVMTKAPRAGKVKTRLTPPLTPEEAAALNICFLRDTAAAIAQTVAERTARGIAVFTPASANEAYADILPEEFDLVPQRGDGFGERLVCAAEDLLAIGFASVCLIDSDSPTVPQTAFSQAVDFLNRSEDSVVLGPSDDGGYYLIGLKKLHRSLFEGIDWSTDRVLEQTMHQARELNLPVHLLPTWYDVDDRATLQRLWRELFNSNGDVPSGFAAPETRRFLDELTQGEGRQRLWPDEFQP
jgi:rSAM/selenodomain-associated transferase 1